MEAFAKKKLQAAHWRELVEALGFDPSQISREMIAQAMDAANVIWDDETLRQDLTTFAKDYIKAQHAVELTNMGGGAALEVVITAIHAALTAGAGLAIATAAKARHLPKLRKLGDLLLEFVEQSKKLARYLKEKAQRAAKRKDKDGGQESHSNEVINPPPTRRVINEKYGTNEAKWTVDEKGRPVSVEAKLDSTYKTARSADEAKLQSNAGGAARLTDDDGGHLVGHRFMSDQGEKNLFPQNANLNRGAYKKMENEWADWTENGYEVKLKVRLDPPGVDRSNNIIARYEVIDPKTGKVVYKNRHNFTNNIGELFDRVPRKKMKGF